MPEYVATEGRTGTAVVYLPALSTRRWIWISDEWQIACPQLARLVLDAIRGRGSKWVLVPTLAQFTQRCVDDAARPARQRRPMDTIALVTAEQKRGEFADIKNVCSFQGLLEFVRKLDVAACSTDVCNM